MQSPDPTAQLSVQSVHAPGDVRDVTAPMRSADDDVTVSRVVMRESVKRAVAREAQDGVGRRRDPHTGSRADAPSAELLALLDALRWTVTRFVADRRDASVPIERVLPEVKSLVREVQAEEQWLDPGGTLLAQVVRWVIEAYYDAPQLRHVPRFY